MALACRDHVMDSGPKGSTGHNSTDGTTSWQRLEKYGRYARGASENISYGRKTGVDIVMALLIDDGVAGRGHRKSMTNGDFEMGGNYTGPHKVFETMTTQNFAGSFTKKEDFPPTDEEMNKSSIRAGAPQLPSEVSELD